MKPVLALTIDPQLNLVTPEVVADFINAYLDREFRGLENAVSVRVLQTPDELAAYESGAMVMYRKPARRFGDRIVYDNPVTGERVELQQERLPL